MNKQKIKVSIKEAKPPKKIPFVIALANKILGIIGFTDFIDRSVEWDKKQWKVSPGNLAKAVILATFYDIRAPLSTIWERYIGIDTELLFGDGILPEHLNDDAIGRALDKIAAANPEKKYGTLCLTAYTIFRIAFKRLHADTTTVSFYGDYETEGVIEPEVHREVEAQEDDKEEKIEPLHIVRGYNKDHRPECKQVVIGKIVSEHGVPVASAVMDGNTSDAEWNKKAVELAVDIFGEGLDQGIYIADSKLVNMEMFRILMKPDKRVRFISRCPANFSDKMEGRMIEKAYRDGQWQDSGKFGNGKNACTYKGQEYTEVIEGHEIRLLVIQSSAGHERFIDKKAKELEKLQKDIVDVNKKAFACGPDAIKEWERFQRSHKNCLYTYSVEYKETRHEKRGRGNPGKNPKPPVTEVKWDIDIQVTGENETAMARFQHTEESFVLISNVSSRECSPKEILGYYKDQTVVETEFRIFKEPCIASVIYLKSPERVRALTMLLSVSLLVRALLQYKMRKGYRESKEILPKVGWNGAKLQAGLTMKFLSYTLQSVYFIREGAYRYSYAFSNTQSELRARTLLKLMDICVEDLLE